ncbi:hypothetical protein DQ04_09691020 [Trypanosoma grayi]|uniref:hypothetical protein n=1 Tax=Trypanosoma grayi TaxID=71804 RepID=UPI0004F424DC|nr:hypothetical protein DQ04_09691020 [Trypanosoma grayi]KEG07474.1 hypothetical protein DQ04_09691020 [Trypanosoma grayi]
MMRMMVHRPLCVFALVLCWASFCVTAAAAEGGVVGSLPATAAAGIEARMAEKEAGLKEKEKEEEEESDGQLIVPRSPPHKDAQAALRMAKEAAMKAKQALEEAKVNADAENSVATKSLRLATLVKKAIGALNGVIGYSRQPPQKSKRGPNEAYITHANEVKREIVEVLLRAEEVKTNAGITLQKTKDAVSKADEALQHVSRAEANAKGVDQIVKDAVGAAKATVTAAKALADNCLLQVERAYNTSVDTTQVVTETDTAARETFSVGDTLIKPDNTHKWSDKLSGVSQKAKAVHDRIQRLIPVFGDVKYFCAEAAKSADKVLASIERQLRTTPTAVKESVSPQSKAEAVLKETLQELKQLQEQAGKLDAPEIKEITEEIIEEQQEQGSAVRDEQSLPPQSEGGAAVVPGKKDGSRPSPTEATTVPVAVADATPEHEATSAPAVNSSMAVEELLASNGDGGSNPALVYAPLLLLLACVSLW